MRDDESRKLLARLLESLPDRRPLVDAWKAHHAFGEEQLRRLAHARDLDWDTMNDDQRQDFVEAILDEP